MSTRKLLFELSWLWTMTGGLRSSYSCSLASSPPSLSSLRSFVHHFSALGLVYPYSKGGTGGVVVSCFANRAERPVDFKGSESSTRGASTTFALAIEGTATVGEVTSFLLTQVGPTPSLGGRLVVFGESGGVGNSADFLFGGYRRAASCNPLSVGRVVLCVGNLYHGYRMPPIYCLGASSFLSCGNPFLRRLAGTSTGGVTGSSCRPFQSRVGNLQCVPERRRPDLGC